MAFSETAIDVMIQALKVYRLSINKKSLYGEKALELLESFTLMQTEIENK